MMGAVDQNLTPSTRRAHTATATIHKSELGQSIHGGRSSAIASMMVGTIEITMKMIQPRTLSLPSSLRNRAFKTSPTSSKRPRLARVTAEGPEEKRIDHGAHG
jgi:hypothetical protein